MIKLRLVVGIYMLSFAISLIFDTRKVLWCRVKWLFSSLEWSGSLWNEVFFVPFVVLIAATGHVYTHHQCQVMWSVVAVFTILMVCVHFQDQNSI